MLYHIRDDAGRVIEIVDGDIVCHVINGVTYRFGTSAGVVTELSSGWKLPGKLSRLLHASASEKQRFCEAVRRAAALAAKHPILPPLPGKK